MWLPIGVPLRADSPNGISIITRAKWALQIASDLVHFAKSSTGYFLDQKLDNIVLQMRGSECNAVLIDFEQRGAWFSWSPPEIKPHRLSRISREY